MISLYMSRVTRDEQSEGARLLLLSLSPLSWAALSGSGLRPCVISGGADDVIVAVRHRRWRR